MFSCQIVIKLGAYKIRITKTVGHRWHRYHYQLKHRFSPFYGSKMSKRALLSLLNNNEYRYKFTLAELDLLNSLLKEVCGYYNKHPYD